MNGLIALQEKDAPCVPRVYHLSSQTPLTRRSKVLLSNPIFQTMHACLAVPYSQPPADNKYTALRASITPRPRASSCSLRMHPTPVLCASSNFQVFRRPMFPAARSSQIGSVAMRQAPTPCALPQPPYHARLIRSHTAASSQALLQPHELVEVLPRPAQLLLAHARQGPPSLSAVAKVGSKRSLGADHTAALRGRVGTRQDPL